MLVAFSHHPKASPTYLVPVRVPKFLALSQVATPRGNPMAAVVAATVVAAVAGTVVLAAAVVAPTPAIFQVQNLYPLMLVKYSRSKL